MRTRNADTSQSAILGLLGLGALAFVFCLGSQPPSSGNPIRVEEPWTQDHPRWMSYPVVQAILKRGDVIRINVQEDYSFENSTAKRYGVETFNFTLLTRTVGHTSLHVRLFGDASLLKDTKDSEALIELQDPAKGLATIRHLLKTIDGEQNTDLIDVHNTNVEGDINTLWHQLNGYRTLAWVGNAVIRAGSQIGMQDRSPGELGYSISSSNDVLATGLSDTLNEMKGQLRRSYKRYTDALKAMGRSLEGDPRNLKPIPIEIKREYYAIKAEFALRYLEEYSKFQADIVATVKR